MFFLTCQGLGQCSYLTKQSFEIRPQYLVLDVVCYMVGSLIVDHSDRNKLSRLGEPTSCTWE